MHVLVLCDDYYHPAQTVRDGLAPLAGEAFQFQFIQDARDWSADAMASYRVVLFAKSNDVSSEDRNPWMTEAVGLAFRDYVRAGGGLLAVHSGTAGYRETPSFRGLLGGVFVHHPKQCPVTVAPVDGGELTEGVGAFTAQDEHYHMELDDAEARIFLQTTSEHGEQPGGWTRIEDRGRVCVLTPGHPVEVWLQPSFQTLLRNSLLWCAGAL